MKKNSVVTILVTLAVVVTLIAVGLTAFIIYQRTHIFVENKAYPISAQSLDLREEDISFAHYDSVHAQLPNCQILWSVPFQGGKVSNDVTRISIQNPSSDDIWLLQTYFPKLKIIDASACDNYTALEQLQEALPNVSVSYTVSLGASVALPDATELELGQGTFDLDTLKEGLLFLHQVKTVTFPQMALTLEEFQGLQEAFPDIDFSYTVDILGGEYESTTKELDLSALTGETLSTDMEEVVLKKKSIGDSGEEEIRLALDLLSNCKRFVLEDCGLSSDVLVKLREDYRDRTKVVWRVYFGNGTSLTDAEVVRSVYDLKDSNCSELQYLEDVKYADFGHDEYLNDSSFLSGMKSLEVLIISGSPIKDLSPLSGCKNLRILEIANCGYITDLSPLEDCESLEMLNISHTKATEGLSALEERNMTHLTAVGGIWNKISQEDRDAFQEDHPDCWIVTSGNEYGVGWRYEDKETKMEWYEKASEAFKYPHAPNNVGWYLE